MDATSVASELRAELAQGGHAGFTPATPSYEPADPSRVPSRWLAWTAAGIALAVLIGYFVWRSFAFAPDAAEPVVAKETSATIAPAAANAPAVTKGEVVLTAKEPVWVRVYDAQKRRLFEAEMKAGESFTIPANADGPMINTGRPQSLKVTIGGEEVAPLGPPERAIKDVGVSAAALLARTPDTMSSTQSAPAT
jgi:cytoskeleton protein RodZ